MIIKEQLLKFADYNLWANKKIGKVLETLDVSSWDKEIPSSFPSLKLTVLHIWNAQEVWYRRLNGESVTGWPVKFEGSGNDLLKGFIEQSGIFKDYVSSKDEKYFNSLCDFKDMKGNPYSINIGDIIQHCMNHSTFHRGQLVTMLHIAGATSLPSTDYITYVRENKN